MRVIVTGSRGFIGGHLVRRLRRDGHDVLGVGTRPGPADGPVGSRYVAAAGQPAALWLPTDWRGGPLTLADLAWDTQHTQPYGGHASHVARLARLLDDLTPLGLAAVVGAGSAAEYGGATGLLAEDDPPEGPLSAYGWGKQAARALVEAWGMAHGRPACWLRPFLVYGPGQAGPLVLPYALRQARAGATARFSDGAQQRDFVHVADVVEAFARAVADPPPCFWTVNLGTGVPVPVREVLTFLADLLGARDRFHFGALPRRRGEPLVQAAATARAATLFGWRAAVDWRTGLRSLVASEQSEGAWAA
jgi:nucleoside-diphosphate-sugar epimerase